MKIKIYIIILLFIGFSLLNNINAQVLNTNNTLTPVQLVQNVLLGGGVTASNITYTGFTNAIGEFSVTGPNSMGINSGVVLTTGSIYANDPLLGWGGGTDGPMGPNNSGSAGLDNNEPGDPDLEILGGTLSYNAAILEFDFIPQSDTVKFKYVFGSEEYMEFVNAGVNDAFGFFLSGPGIAGPFSNGAVNLAVLPNGTPVTIDDVNANNNGAYYVDNENPPGQLLQYDGHTVVLTAVHEVQCGLTYHIKIAICDIGDGVWDSGVFLEAGSFSSSGGIQLSSAVEFGNNDTTLIEGCNGAVIGVKRLGDISNSQNVTYTVGGTATMGTDFPNLSGTVTFPANVDSVTIPIAALLDGVADAGETIIITVTTTNNCGLPQSQSITLYISEAPPITVDAGNDVTVDCQTLGNGINLTATATGGVAPLSYSWSNGMTGDQITIVSGGNTTLYVNVTDACNTMIATDSVSITVVGANPLSVNVSNDTLVCVGELVTLQANAVGGNGNVLYQWNTGSTNPVTNISALTPFTYTVTVTDDCGITATETIFVDVSIVDASFIYNYTTVDGEVEFNNLSAGNIVSYQWDFGDGGNSTEISPTHIYVDPDNYDVILTVTNDIGCTDVATANVPITVNAFVFIPNSFTPNQDGLNEFFTIYGKGFLQMEMRIFDRWGKEIFNTNKPDTGWDGKDNQLNTFYPMGVYAYRIDIKDLKGLDKTFTGHVNLIR